MGFRKHRNRHRDRGQLSLAGLIVGLARPRKDLPIPVIDTGASASAKNGINTSDYPDC